MKAGGQIRVGKAPPQAKVSAAKLTMRAKLNKGIKEFSALKARLFAAAKGIQPKKHEQVLVMKKYTAYEYRVPISKLSKADVAAWRALGLVKGNDVLFFKKGLSSKSIAPGLGDCLPGAGAMAGGATLKKIFVQMVPRGIHKLLGKYLRRVVIPLSAVKKARISPLELAMIMDARGLRPMSTAQYKRFTSIKHMMKSPRYIQLINRRTEGYDRAEVMKVMLYLSGSRAKGDVLLTRG